MELNRPIIVCLCGSTKFKDAFTRWQLNETLNGKIVLTIGCNMKSDQEIFGNMSPSELRLTKSRLDVLHFAKIDLADEILVLNIDVYIGESTEREIEYARMHSKKIRFLEKKHLDFDDTGADRGRVLD